MHHRDPTDAGGTYRLQNDLFFTPLRHGDVEGCEIDADAILEVVEIMDVPPDAALGSRVVAPPIPQGWALDNEAWAELGVDHSDVFAS